jgi:hypothetical protein
MIDHLRHPLYDDLHLPLLLRLHTSVLLLQNPTDLPCKNDVDVQHVDGRGHDSHNKVPRVQRQSISITCLNKQRFLYTSFITFYLPKARVLLHPDRIRRESMSQTIHAIGVQIAHQHHVHRHCPTNQDKHQ